MGRNKMIAKSCPKCEMQVAVASKSCKCGHTFFAARRAADHLPAVEDIKRRTGRVRRSRTQFYDAQHYQKQIKRRSPKKRDLSRSMEYDYKGKEKSESATALARRRRALRRARRSPAGGDRTRDPTPQLRPSQLARCKLILQPLPPRPHAAATAVATRALQAHTAATALARRRRALRRARRSPAGGDRTRDPTPQLRPSQLARCKLILQEINRKMQAVTWQPPADG